MKFKQDNTNQIAKKFKQDKSNLRSKTIPGTVTQSTGVGRAGRCRCRALKPVEQGGTEQGGWRLEPGGQGGRQSGTTARRHGRRGGGSRV
jgi:hypothetical protein